MSIDPSWAFTGVIKTKTHVMSARKIGDTFYASLGADISAGDPFEYDGENYIAREVAEKPFATRIIAWRAW